MALSQGLASKHKGFSLIPPKNTFKCCFQFRFCNPFAHCVFQRGMPGRWYRKYPIILPHELLPWLHRNGAFPEIAASELQKYWGRMRMRGGTVADIVSAEMESRCHPLYIWGDDAKYTSAHDKLLVIVMGHCLDPNTYSVECCWPLLALREVTWWMFLLVLCFIPSLQMDLGSTCIKKSTTY